ncbi:MAG TPA: TIGR02281 family clan AA aspartic protease [Ensifer sp.]|nr:TIGR02281 family clan AA aspartic protease [Ensifer sp.]
MRMLAVVFAILGLGLALLLINHDSGQTLGLSNDDFGHFIYLLPIAIMIGSGALASRGRLRRNLTYLAIWAVVALVSVAAYVYQDEARHVGRRVLAELMPGHSVVLTGINGQNEVVIRRTQAGHFAVNAHVDGQRVGMLIDTGASQVTLTYDDARRAGLKPETLKFSMPVTTANGTGQAAPVTIPELAVGPIVRKNVAAAVAQEGRLDTSLLGMNFLSSLSAVQIQPNEMRLMD